MKILIQFCLLMAWLSSAAAASYSGTVIDTSSKQPIEGAFVTLGEQVVRSGRNGKFQLDGIGDTLGIRAYGHVRRAVSTLNKDAPILLAAYKPKALYLSLLGVTNKQLRNAALNLIHDTELNALVIDVKDDMGRAAFPGGAGRPISNFKAIVNELHAKGIYLIARIVVFKDNPLATGRPDIAIKTTRGAIWKDREGLAWSNPYSQTVRNINIDLAIEAAKAGFDEIQFDYVRFPDATGLAYSMPNTEENRVAAISGFLSDAGQKLVPYNVFLSADIFGYVSWNTNDTFIGQKLDNLAEVLDYISPMLYPSGFQFGIPGYLDPVHHPREIVYYSLEKATQRTKLPGIRFRPWLQAFRDYAFNRMPFKGEQIRAQIEAADSMGSCGWMLWNPHNIYSRDGLQLKNSNVQEIR